MKDKNWEEVADMAKTLSTATLEVLGFIFVASFIFGAVMGGLVIVLGNIYGP